MRKTLLICGALTTGLVNAQYEGRVGINTTTPAVTLDVEGKPTETTVLDGIKPPVITLAQLNSKTYPTTAKGAMVYVTDMSSLSGTKTTQTKNIISEGLYVFNGTSWSDPSKGDIIPWTTEKIYVCNAGDRFDIILPEGVLSCDDELYHYQGRANRSNGSNSLDTSVVSSLDRANTGMYYSSPISYVRKFPSHSEWLDAKSKVGAPYSGLISNDDTFWHIPNTEITKAIPSNSVTNRYKYIVLGGRVSYEGAQQFQLCGDNRGSGGYDYDDTGLCLGPLYYINMAWHKVQVVKCR